MKLVKMPLRRLKSQEERDLENKIKEAKKKLREQKEENRKKELLIRALQVFTEAGNFLELQKFTPDELKEVMELIDEHLNNAKQQIEESMKNEDTDDQVEATVVAPPHATVDDGQPSTKERNLWL
ncbi:hypothetical protein Fmac_001691 [Flemingia macrophylla]|uniref:Uncharacterized protein n=1 Tax=Flemingia macrophylla TaxID=520843 RepID=A0ABD1NI03_9FABA